MDEPGGELSRPSCPPQGRGAQRRWPSGRAVSLEGGALGPHLTRQALLEASRSPRPTCPWAQAALDSGNGETQCPWA